MTAVNICVRPSQKAPVGVAGVGTEDDGDHHDDAEDQEDPEAEDGRQEPDL